MRSTIRYVGLDVHKEKVVIAVAEKGGGAENFVRRMDAQSASGYPRIVRRASSAVRTNL